ncbi:competence type IV pilus major pilin ComGC [Levilactobacillus bambusae]|uniref:Competence protein ComGC n=1 Tax=Levilactobacillus bambusae TaxID=2024736 RepID=A0A2V1MYP7_9LACO|nr:competence type IV pilus major pilin ComGC [Levilactobacillus bambusae]PWF99607.1 competence protein ComGC [Levilactobacillus bambusae]
MRKLRGFTLIEMAVVLFIISLLVLVIIPNLSSQRKRASQIHGDAMTTVVQTQVDLFQDKNQVTSLTFADLEKAGYLTDKQVAQAKREGIEIRGSEVVQK